jgi:hypothetical protein
MKTGKRFIEVTSYVTSSKEKKTYFENYRTTRENTQIHAIG